MILTNATYTIQKRNFVFQPCPFCQGTVKNISDPESNLTVGLNHPIYPVKLYLRIPRCRKCADVYKPIRKIMLLGAAIGAVTGFMTLVHNNLFFAFLLAFTCAGMGALFMGGIAHVAFKIVYKQSGIVYDVLRICEDKYGWTATPQQNVDYSTASEEEFGKIFTAMLKECDCEVVENDVKKKS